MVKLDPNLRSRALAAIPDEPRHVIARCMLLAERATVVGDVASDGFLLHDAQRSTVAMVGRPSRDTARQLGVSGGMVVIAAPSSEPQEVLWPECHWISLDLWALNDVLPNRKPSDNESLVPVQRLEAGSPLVGQIPPDFRATLSVALSLGPVYVALVGGRIVAAACCYWRSESWYDLSVDTLPEYRCKGFGWAVAQALIRGLWPARPVHANHPSETLARDFVASLGLRPVGHIRRGSFRARPGSG